MDINVRVTVDAGPTFAPLANALAGLMARAVQQSIEAVGDLGAELRKEDNVPFVAEAETEEVAKPKPTRTRPSRAAAKEATTEEEPLPESIPEPVPGQKPAETQKPKATAQAEELSDEDHLDAIRARVTQGVKDGKGDEIRSILSAFGLRRASELQPMLFNSFDDCLTRLEAGEKAADIVKNMA